MLTLRILCFAAVVFAASAGKARAAADEELVLDTGGANAFLELCRSPGPVAPEAIDRLLAVDGYRRMIRWTRENWYDLDESGWRTIFRAALVPDRYSLKESFPPFDRLVRIIRDAHGQCRQVEEYLAEAIRTLNPAEFAPLVRKYVPEHARPDQPRLSLVVGLGQGGVSGNDIVIDIYGAVDKDSSSDLRRWIAHEMHHVYRNGLDPQDAAADEQHEAIAQALFWLETEGIADMVTHDGQDHSEILGSMWEGWRPIFLDAGRYLARLDPAFRDLLSGATTPEEGWKTVSEILARDNAYHPVGLAMARRIESELGRSALTACVGKPWKFLETYQEAAKKIADPEKAYVFDDSVVERISAIDWR